MKYKPDPINTADVVLPPVVDEIVELIYKDVHEVWASQKFQGGFSYAVADDNVQKRTTILFHTASSRRPTDNTTEILR